MAANTAPIFTDVPVVGAGAWTSSLTGNTTSTGVSTIGTSSILLFSAGADGSYINRVRLTPSGSVAATATTATVARLYVSTVASGATTAANTFLVAEVALSSQTTDQTASAVTPVEIPCGFYIPTGYYLLLSMHAAAAANTQWTCVAFGGHY